MLWQLKGMAFASEIHGVFLQLWHSVYIMSVWLAPLVKALAAPTHVRSCVQEVRVRSPERTSSTLASIPPGCR